MAKKGPGGKLAGIVFLVAGGGLGIWAWQKSEGFESQLNSALTGSHTDNVMLLAIGAAVCLAIGAFLVVRK